VRRTVIALVAATVALTACGGGSGSSREDQVRGAVRGYLKAFASGDAKGACNLLTPQGQKQAVQGGKAKGFTRCDQTVKLLHDAIDKRNKGVLDRLAAEKITKVEFFGSDKAVATLAAGLSGSQSRVDLKKVGGKWLVDQDQA